MKVYYITNGLLLDRKTRREKSRRLIKNKVYTLIDWLKKYSGILLLSLLCLFLFVLGNC